LQNVVDTTIEATGLLGLTVWDVTVEGRETTDRETILAALAVKPGSPILAVSPKHAKQQLENLPWVRSAVIERRLPGTLYVRLVERKPLALWQHGGKIELIDRAGAVIPVARLDRFAKLPMVVGEGAASHAAEPSTCWRANRSATRVTATIRVGAVEPPHDNAIDVLLPADETAGAGATRPASTGRARPLAAGRADHRYQAP
jgi:cell division protein FtsQ